MNRSEIIATASAGAAVATSSLSLGDWASIASIAAATFSVILNLINTLRRPRNEPSR